MRKRKDFSMATSRSTSRTFLIAAAILLTGGSCLADDWTQTQHDALHSGASGENFDPRNLQFLWSAPTGIINSVIQGNSVYLNNRTTLTNYDLATGQVNWSSPISGRGSMAYFNGMLAAVSST